jgi:hypothetical protein
MSFFENQVWCDTERSILVLFKISILHMWLGSTLHHITVVFASVEVLARR